MSWKKHFWMSCALCCAATVTFAQTVQNYPMRPVRVIVPQAPGGTADTVARALAPAVSGALGQQLVIDNRGGAGGAIGSEMAAKAVPDGYTICLNGTGPMTVLPHLQAVAYDPLRDFMPLTLITSSGFALVTNPAVPAKTVNELISLAKSQPGKLVYASAGTGSVVYLGMELFKSMAGVEITHAPYKGSAQGLTDVLGGHVALMLFAIPPARAHAKADRLRVLAVTSAKRSRLLPDTPSLAESGLAGYDVTTWTGMFVPPKTPANIAARVRDAVVAAAQSQELQSHFEALGMDAVSSTPPEFSAFLRADYLKNGKIIKAAGAKAG